MEQAAWEDRDARYARQLQFAGIGREGQTRLRQAKVVIVGAGALGTALSNHLVRAGVGFVRLIDRDVVELGNLHRQMLFDETDAARLLPKAIAAARKLRTINSQVTVEPVFKDLNAANAEALLGDADLILDGTDNFHTRFLINDVSVKHGIPWIYGGVVGARGATMTVLPGETPCFRCLYPHAPAHGTMETCDTTGVIGPAVHVTASLQAGEALKLLAGAREKLNAAMMIFDLWENRMDRLELASAKRDDCPACGAGYFSFLDAAAEPLIIRHMCGKAAISLFPAEELALNLEQWADRLAGAGVRVQVTKYLARAYLESGLVLTLFPDGRAIVQGTEDPARAKSVYVRYLGA